MSLLSEAETLVEFRGVHCDIISNSDDVTMSPDDVMIPSLYNSITSDEFHEKLFGTIGDIVVFIFGGILLDFLLTGNQGLTFVIHANYTSPRS